MRVYIVFFKKLLLEKSKKIIKKKLIAFEILLNQIMLNLSETESKNKTVWMLAFLITHGFYRKIFLI